MCERVGLLRLEARLELFAKNFKHGFALRAIHLGKRFLYERSVVGAAIVQHFSQPEGCVAQQYFGVFEPLVIIPGTQMHLVGQCLDLFEQVTRLVHVARRVLLQAELSHLVNQFGVEEALLAWLSPGIRA